MSYVIEEIHNSSALLLKLDPSLDTNHGILEMYQDLKNRLDQASQSMTIIYDIKGLPIRLDLLMEMTKTMKDNQNLNPANHSKVSKTIVITDSKIINLSIDGFQKFGGTDKPTLVATSKEEALSMASS